VVKLLCATKVLLVFYTVAIWCSRA